MMKPSNHTGFPLRRLAAATALSLLIAASAHAAKKDARRLKAIEYEEYLTAAFKGKSPEYIARYFVHPNGFCANYAMVAMEREHGKQAVGLLTKLLKDENPIMRYSAVKVLGNILLPESARVSRRRKGAPPQGPVPPEVKQLTKLIEPMAYDKHPAVQQAVAETFSQIAFDNESIQHIALKMADSPDLTVRSMALKFGQQVIKDPNARVMIGATVSRHINIPRMWGYAHGLIAAHKDSKVCRQGLPALIHFQAHVANTRPVRGMFSDSPQKAALEALLAQWDAEVEKMPDAVAAICCAFVRLPYNGHPGWVISRKTSLDILHKMTPAAAPAIAAYVKKERLWLDRAGDLEVRQLGETSEGRKNMTTAIDYLEYAGQCIAAGKPITRECPLRTDPAYKPEMPELRLDNPEIRPMP